MAMSHIVSDELANFAYSLNVEVTDLRFIAELPNDMQQRIMTEFDPSGTKDGNVLGRLRGFAASQARRAGLVMTGAQTSLATTWAQQEDLVATFAAQLGVAPEQLSFMYELPDDMQGKIAQGFDPAGTKDGNVLGRLRGYAASHARRAGIAVSFASPQQPAGGDAISGFAAHIGVPVENLHFLYELPSDMQARIMEGFDPSGTKDGNVLGRLQGYVASQARRAGLSVSSNTLALQDDPIAGFAQYIGVPCESLNFMYELPVEMQAKVIEGFDPTGTKDGNVLGRLQGYVASIARKVGVTTQAQHGLEPPRLELARLDPPRPSRKLQPPRYEDPITLFARSIGVPENSLAFMYDLSPEIRSRVIQGFDPRGTKDGNVLGRLQGYVNSLTRSSGQTRRDDPIPRFAQFIGVSRDSLSFMYELPADMLARVVEGFDPSGTKDGNVLGRLQGYVASIARKAGIQLNVPRAAPKMARVADPIGSFAQSLGLTTDDVWFMYEVPPDMQQRVIEGFNPSGTKDGNVLGRLQGYISSFLRNAGIHLDLHSGAASPIQTRRPVRELGSPKLVALPAHSGDSLPSGLDKAGRDLLASLPPRLREVAKAEFQADPSKDGTSASRVLGHVVTKWANMLELDAYTLDFIRGLPAEVQKKILRKYDVSDSLGKTIEILDYATAAMEETMLGDGDATPASSSGADASIVSTPATMGHQNDGQWWPEDSRAFAVNLGLLDDQVEKYLSLPTGVQAGIMKSFDSAGTSGDNLWARLLAYAKKIAWQVGCGHDVLSQLNRLYDVARAAQQASRGIGGGYAAPAARPPVTEAKQFAAMWKLDNNALTFLQALPRPVLTAVMQGFDGSGTKDGNVWGRLLPYCRMQWVRWLGVDKSFIAQIKELPEEAQLSCLMTFDPSTSKDGDIGGRLTGFLKKVRAQASRLIPTYNPVAHGGHTPSNGSYSGAYVGGKASRGGSAALASRPEVAQFIQRIGVDESAAGLLLPLPEGVLQEVISTFDPSGTKDGNVLGRLEGYVRCVTKKRAGIHEHVRSVRARTA